MDETFAEEVLDLFYELTNIPILLYLSEDDKFLGKKNLPEYCHIVIELSPSDCAYWHHEKDLHMCKAGLWCKFFPIEADGEVLGSIIIGHKRLKGHDYESRRALKFFTDLNALNRFDSCRLVNAFERVPEVEERGNREIPIRIISILKRIVIMEYNGKKLLELEKKTKELEEHSKEITIRSVQAAHEFQIPIQSMVNIAEYLYNYLKVYPKFSSPNREHSASDMAYDLFERLIKLSYISSNLRNILDDQTLRYDFRSVDYIDLLNDASNLFREEARKKGVIVKDIKLINSSGSSRHTIQASEPHLRQVFFNILHNAVKYSFEGNRENERFIEIDCREKNDSHICIEISNYGIGITEQELREELIFEKGYRGRLASDRSRIGSGLGLWIAKRIIDDHHGKIEIESKKVGEGEKVDPYLTRVKIYLPKIQDKIPA